MFFVIANPIVSNKKKNQNESVKDPSTVSTDDPITEELQAEEPITIANNKGEELRQEL